MRVFVRVGIRVLCACMCAVVPRALACASDNVFGKKMQVVLLMQWI